MPNLDGTGPQGQGPRTGRGLGNCNDNNAGGNYGGYGRGRRYGRGFGRGFGNGWGRGRGFGRGWRWFGNSNNPNQDKNE